MLHDLNALWDTALIEHKERLREATAHRLAASSRAGWRTGTAARLRRWADTLQPPEGATRTLGTERLGQP